jgi:hypothetical protein
MNDKDLRSVILQTLEELDEEVDVAPKNKSNIQDEQFLLDLREKMLVLFEGLQSPNMINLDKKLDLTINFLEYILSEIDKKLQNTK